MRKHLVIATRGSRLALWQAEHVKSRLEAQDPELTVSLNVIKTRGDIILDVCRKGLAAEHPELAKHCQVMLPDEKTRRVGQSVAAASLPEIRK